MPFDPFRRFRLRSHPVSAFPTSSEEDTDDSSPERDRPRIIHVPAAKTDRRSGERPPQNRKCVAERLTEGTHIAVTLDKSPHPAHDERPSKKSPTPGVARSGSQAMRSRPSTRTLPGDTGLHDQGPHSRRTATAPPPLPNGFVSKQHREAALRERGLLPPCKDLSEQEREADERLGSVPSPTKVAFDGSTEAEQFKATWLSVNRTSEGSDPLQGTRQPLSSIPSDVDVLRRSCEGKPDLPPAGRPSFCSSIPPLSTSSYLEVLHEDPSEQPPITPPPPFSRAILPVIVSSSLDCPPSPILVESPISCAFSSNCPGSTLESQSQCSHPPPVPEKENIRSHVSRRRTSDSGDRPHRAVGSSLSRFGTHSLTNLRRSVAGSLRVSSSNTLSSADHSSTQAPRMAIDPTMHSLGSILRETKDIQDAESRRLSELAFLD